VKALRLRPKAADDLETIWLHIARDDPLAADAFVDHLTELFELLRASPLIWAACPDLRRFPTQDYFYSVHEESLVIERILHGARHRSPVRVMRPWAALARRVHDE